MKRYQLIGALAAFMITFILCTVFNSCTVKAGAEIMRMWEQERAKRQQDMYAE